VTDGHDITQLAKDLLEQARAADSGRAGATVFGGSTRSLRQTVVALAAGRELSEHENPGEATLHVLTGEVTLSSDGQTVTVGEGQLVAIPLARHALLANSDAVVLLTVAKLDQPA
jgi:quercetin dioxygenase-like cupin family protein